MPTPTKPDDALPADVGGPEPILTSPELGVAAHDGDGDGMGRTDLDRIQVKPAPDAYLGTVVDDRYRILGKLGQGGMGAVYLAEHKVIERKVAIKILSQDFARKADLVQRFIQEARAAARIGHENIVEVYDFGETISGSVFFAMEHLEGKDLAQLIRTESPLPIPRIKHIITQICRAVGAAHGKQIIHRDLKPENIFLITKEGKTDFVKVLDFGIAKMSNIEEDKGRLTRTGMLFGTPEYMSPEQARGESPDHRVDIYAVGCLLYEMLTGTVPFTADSFMAVLTKHMLEPVEPPSRRSKARIPADIEAVCLRALTKDRDQRFQTLQELALALEGDTARAVLVPPVVSGQVPVGPLQAMSGQVPVGPLPSLVFPSILPMLHPGHRRTMDATAQSPLPMVPPRSRRVWFILAGVLVGLLVLGGALYRSWLSPEDLEKGELQKDSQGRLPTGAGLAGTPGEPAQIEHTARLILRCPPGANGADVLVNDHNEGKMPLDMQIPLAGARELTTHLLIRKKGFSDYEEMLVLHPGQIVELDVPLIARRPPGVKAVASHPDLGKPEEGPKQELRNPFGLKRPF